MIVRCTTEKDIDEIYTLINKVPLESCVFIKSTKEEIAQKIKTSYVCIADNKIVGVCMVQECYIDTIVASKKGAGSKLLSSIKKGGYYTNISDLNEKSIRLFKKFGFKKVGIEYINNEKRGRYAGIIK